MRDHGFGDTPPVGARLDEDALRLIRDVARAIRANPEHPTVLRNCCSRLANALLERAVDLGDLVVASEVTIDVDFDALGKKPPREDD